MLILFNTGGRNAGSCKWGRGDTNTWWHIRDNLTCRMYCTFLAESFSSCQNISTKHVNDIAKSVRHKVGSSCLYFYNVSDHLAFSCNVIYFGSDSFQLVGYRCYYLFTCSVASPGYLFTSLFLYFLFWPKNVFDQFFCYLFAEWDVQLLFFQIWVPHSGEWL